MGKYIKFTYSLVLISIFNICTNVSAQISSNNITVLANNYKLNLIELNLGNWIKFLPNSVNTDSILKKKQIIELVSSNIKIINTQSIPFSIIKKFKTEGIGANAFFVYYEGRLDKDDDQGDFVPNIAPLSYKWKKLSDSILFFIYIGAPIGSELEKYIFIPNEVEIE